MEAARATLRGVAEPQGCRGREVEHSVRHASSLSITIVWPVQHADAAEW